METGAISIIKNTEAEAHRIVDDAKAKADLMINEIEKSSKEFLNQTIEEVSKENERKLDDISKKSIKIVENNKMADKQNADGYEEKARLRLMGAVKIILKEITEECQ